MDRTSRRGSCPAHKDGKPLGDEFLRRRRAEIDGRQRDDRRLALIAVLAFSSIILLGVGLLCFIAAVLLWRMV